jgi:hypothetical protein
VRGIGDHGTAHGGSSAWVRLVVRIARLVEIEIMWNALSLQVS